jgi:flavin reductase (DIM6/NTAB) family NADH-FMN oxidoreductase RutF
MKQTEVIPAAGFKTISIKDFAGAPAARIGEGWMLITSGDVSGDKSNWNTMTASWGALGVLWGKNVAFMFIRPERATFSFASENPLFTLSFFPESFRAALDIAGTKSGRDIDKAKEAGITPVFFSGGPEDGAIGFAEAAEIIVCRKIYSSDFEKDHFADPALAQAMGFGAGAYHRMFIGEIAAVKSRL